MGLFSELKVTVPWGHIALKAWGSRKNPPVLCLHGWLDNANSFDRLIPLLPKDFQYVAMDFGGHGLSSHYSPGLSYHQQHFVSEIRRVVAAFNWTKVSFVGHSFGGSVASMFSCLFPELVDKLVLLDTIPFFLDTNLWMNPQEMENVLAYRRRAIEHVLKLEASQRPPRVFGREELLQWFLKNNTHMSKACGELLLQRGARKVDTGLVLNRDQRISWPENNLEFVSKEMFRNFTRSLQAPMLLIKAKQGYHDVRRENDGKKEIMFFMVDVLSSSLKEFWFVEVPGNHYVHMMEPHLVASIISPFLQGKPLAKL